MCVDCLNGGMCVGVSFKERFELFVKPLWMECSIANIL